MKFGEKVKTLRLQKHLTQAELAEKAGVSLRTIINYENESRYPKKREVYALLAAALEADERYLLSEDEEFLLLSREEYGPRGEKGARELLGQTAALFAGGELSDDDKLAFVTEIQQLYLESKQTAREKFTPLSRRGK